MVAAPTVTARCLMTSGGPTEDNLEQRPRKVVSKPSKLAGANNRPGQPQQPEEDAPMGGTVSNGCSGIFVEEGEDDMASSCSSGRPKVPTYLANGAYHVTKKLGSGSYSDVYACFDTRTGEKVAAKFEWINAEKTGKLLAEAEMCKTFAEKGSFGSSRRNCVPFVRWVGTQGEYNIMVMDVLGPSIEDLLEKCGGSFSLRTVLMLGEQMVTLLEYVHARGVLHRDIKPNNFLIGLGENKDKVYIVDFGLSRRYIDQNGKHIPWVKKKGFTGTVRYITRNLHDGNEPSRRDDLGSVGYVLMYTLLGRLPWQGISAKSKKTKQRRIGARKLKVPHEKLCKGFPPELQRYLEYCDELQYDETPDYNHLRSLFRTALQRLDEEEDQDRCGPRKFDWLLAPDERPPPAPNAKRKRIRNNSIPVEDDICMIPAEVAEAKRRKVSAEAKVAGEVTKMACEAPSPVDNEPEVESVSSEESDKEESSESEEYEYEYEESEEEKEASAEESESEDEESEEESEEDDKDDKDSKKAPRYQ